MVFYVTYVLIFVLYTILLVVAHNYETPFFNVFYIFLLGSPTVVDPKSSVCFSAMSSLLNKIQYPCYIYIWLECFFFPFTKFGFVCLCLPFSTSFFFSRLLDPTYHVIATLLNRTFGMLAESKGGILEYYHQTSLPISLCLGLGISTCDS